MIWFASDHHFGRAAHLTCTNDDGSMRPRLSRYFPNLGWTPAFCVDT
jgi:hypothetical protein